LDPIALGYQQTGTLSFEENWRGRGPYRRALLIKKEEQNSTVQGYRETCCQGWW